MICHSNFTNSILANLLIVDTGMSTVLLLTQPPYSLRTRIAFVQNSEQKLEERDRHRESSHFLPPILSKQSSSIIPNPNLITDQKVVQAFESALALLDA